MIDSPLGIALFAFAMVFVTLSVLSGALFLLRRLARRTAQEPLFKAQPEHSQHEEFDPDIIVVLAAAAHAALGAPVRIHHVHVHRGRQAGEDWARSGRMDIMTSHRVDRKR
jgi:Na+-transporting methylmalonyl-CoA/oxaloacetate decarboxylase gamma subunit